MADGTLGFDRFRLRGLLHATDEAIVSARVVRATDWHARDAMATLGAAVDHLDGAWRHAITATLGGTWFERPVSGVPNLVLVARPGAARLRHPLLDRRAGDRSMPLDDLLRHLDHVAAAWPHDREGRYVTTIELLDADDRTRLRMLAGQIDADPAVLAAFSDAVTRGARLDDVELLGMMAAAGWFRPAVAVQVAALVGLMSIIHAATSDVTMRRAAIAEQLATSLDLAPHEALAALEHVEVREWLVRDDRLDPDAVAAFLAAGIHTAGAVDPALRARSEDVWLAFVDLAERFGARGLPPGVASGLALGSAAHLPGLAQSDDGLVFRRRGPVLDLDGRQLRHERFVLLVGAIVADPTAQAVLADLVYDTAISGYRSHLQLLETDAATPPADVIGALREGLTPAVDAVDLVFDDAISFQRQRWNDAALADIAGRRSALDLLGDITRLAPAGGAAGFAARQIVREALGHIRDGIDPDPSELEPIDAARGLDTQLAREIVATATTTRVTRRAFGVSHLDATTIDALDRFATETSDVAFHDVDDVVDHLVRLGATERDRSTIAATVKDLLEPLTTELEPTRDG